MEKGVVILSLQGEFHHRIFDRFVNIFHKSRQNICINTPLTVNAVRKKWIETNAKHSSWPTVPYHITANFQKRSKGDPHV
jgi:hypothetical protein